MYGSAQLLKEEKKQKERLQSRLSEMDMQYKEVGHPRDQKEVAKPD